MKHVVFFDGDCPFCNQIVRFLMQADKKGTFGFAPLQGKTADTYLTKPIKEDTLVLLENYRTAKSHEYFYAKGALRIYWLLGGVWRFLGIFSFFPSLFTNPFYRWIAKHRHILIKGENKEGKLVEEGDERMLP